MIITGTSDKIQFKLGSTAATELPFTVDYNNYTATGVTLISNNGTSNDTTAVDLVPSPSSGQQNELRYCSIYNADSVTQNIIIQVYDGTNTRVVFRATLGVGDTLQYQLEKGWELLDSLGNKENYGIHAFNSSINGQLGWRPGSIASTTSLVSTTWYFVFLGRADKSYTTINLLINVIVSPSTITYAEAAIYNNKNYFSLDGVGGGISVRAGVTNIATPVATTGVKNITISTSGIQTGDRLYAIIAHQASPTVMQLRNNGFVDAGANQYTVASAIGANGGRPSTVANGYIPATATGQSPLWIIWQGT